jgi:hypothetical protein
MQQNVEQLMKYDFKALQQSVVEMIVVYALFVKPFVM